MSVLKPHLINSFKATTASPTLERNICFASNRCSFLCANAFLTLVTQKKKTPYGITPSNLGMTHNVLSNLLYFYNLIFL